MTKPDPTLPVDKWSLVAARVEELNAAWSADALIPDLPQFMSSENEEIRHLLMLELIKADLENRWSRGLQRFIEEYYEDFPELVGAVPGELIFEEYHIRRAAGDEVSLTDLTDRFPQQKRELMSLLAVNPSFAASRDQLTSHAWKQTQAGQRLGDFDLLVELGAGSFARVFYARQRSMQRLVAVKVSEDRGNEGLTLAQLDHECIVRVYDQQRIPDLELRLLYMQYLPGGTLAEMIRELRNVPRDEWNGTTYLRILDRRVSDRGDHWPNESAVRTRLMQMSWPEVVCWIGSRLASALVYAHQRQVLHRDLKPANILLTAEGVPKLADFNISFSGQTADVSAEEHFGGSLAYMSPEQLRACDPEDTLQAGDLDERADLFSLGALLWELLHGKRPFHECTSPVDGMLPFKSLLEARRNGVEPDRVSAVGTADSSAVDIVLRQCLRFERTDRPSSAAELQRELELCQDPEARRLLAPQQGVLRRQICRYPIPATALVTLLPNSIGAVFNFRYNKTEIQLHLPEATDDFMWVQSVINAVAFPIGIFIGIWLMLSIAAAVRAHDAATAPARQLQLQRKKCVQMGWLIGCLSLTLWLLAAPAYPLTLHVMRGDLPAVLYGHFLASLALCGLIGAAYPFLGVSCLSIRCFYPSLLRWDTVHRDDIRLLEQLSQTAWLSILCAAMVPMLGAGIMVLVDSDQRSSLLALTVGGALGFGVALTMFRLLQRDIATLTRILTANLKGPSTTSH